MKEVQIIAKLADLQETDYRNTLVLHALIDILVAKGLLTHDELTEKVIELDSQLSFQLDTIAQLSNAISRRQTQTKPLL
ncbi:hypothetical protein [Brevibacillus parabrevis]|uniref:Nitrile hydratase subunit beta n=1 Tax=Brevibacillus parabrevis TaxID=54914 RepID=A0A4Y3PIH9_BREPA|nr:hypothetical protein [Brevibacillus parabrevis]RNB97413.1 hypothetical protein EDM60_00865 [Brevibacillus parabrevis]GEB34300.1 hypothetical protein BPA01_38800 [Brevibacillus parabrevis]